jgi:hypothetical protein
MFFLINSPSKWYGKIPSYKGIYNLSILRSLSQFLLTKINLFKFFDYKYISSLVKILIKKKKISIWDPMHRHPLNLEWDLMLKKLKIMWEEISPRFKELGPNNNLLINDCPYKCIGNPPFSYILPRPFNNMLLDSYLLDSLWPYLLGLFEAPSTLGYVGGKSTHATTTNKIEPTLESLKSLCMV